MPRKARISAAVLTLLSDGKRHAWTLDELHEDLVQQGLGSDFSSVYRAAEKLVASGKIRKILLDDGRTRLELVAAHHDHLYCIRCNKLAPVPCVMGQREIVALERKTGAVITDHHLVLNGICRNCRSAVDFGVT